MQMIPGARSNKGHLVPTGRGGHVWHSCLVGKIKSWTEYLWLSPPSAPPVFIIVDVTRFRELRKAEDRALRISAIVAWFMAPLSPLLLAPASLTDGFSPSDDLYGCGLVIWIAGGIWLNWIWIYIEMGWLDIGVISLFGNWRRNM